MFSMKLCVTTAWGSAVPSEAWTGAWSEAEAVWAVTTTSASAPDAGSWVVAPEVCAGVWAWTAPAKGRTALAQRPN